MERLTHERSNGIKTGYWSPEKKEVLVQRLAEYENTGLEPDQIRKIVMSMPTAFDKEKVIEKLKEMQNHSESCKHQCEFASTEYFDYMGAEVAYKTAIAIVEKGG